MLGKLKSEVRKLKAELAKLKPASAPGMLTNRTTRGVTRRSITTANTSGKASDDVPRWG